MKKDELSKVLWLLLLCLPILGSCGLTPIEEQIPIPERNPVITSASAKTIIVNVKNLNTIFPENPESDKVTSYNIQTATQNPWVRIENGWIILYQEVRGRLEVTVAQNTTGESRQYVVGLGAKGKKAKLTIIQNAQ